jgi:hypothetical protein
MRRRRNSAAAIAWTTESVWLAWSVKNTFASLGWAGPKSVARDLFGYRRARIPTNVDGSDSFVSLKWWATRTANRSFSLNVIAVGIESFTDAMWQEVDIAVHRIRQVYDAAGISVRWALPWFISTADADGLDVITSSDEVNDLLEGWAVDNAGIDLYFPAGWSVPGGLLGRDAHNNGPCPGKKKGKGRKGTVAGLTGVMTSSRTAAHEVGHYLSLTHRNNDGTNLMCQTGSANAPTWLQVALTSGQIADILKHCMVRDT